MKSCHVSVSSWRRLVLLNLCVFVLFCLCVPHASAELKNSSPSFDRETPEVELYQNESGEWKIRYLNMAKEADIDEEMDSTDVSSQASNEVELYQDSSGEWKVRYLSNTTNVQDQNKGKARTEVVEKAKSPAVETDATAIEEQINNQIDMQSQEFSPEVKSVDEIQKDNVVTITQSVPSPIQKKIPAAPRKSSHPTSAPAAQDEFTVLSEQIESALDGNSSKDSFSGDVVIDDPIEENVGSEVVQRTDEQFNTPRVNSSMKTSDKVKVIKEDRDLPLDEDELEKIEEVELVTDEPEVIQDSALELDKKPMVYVQEESRRKSNHRIEVGTDVFRYDFQQKSRVNNLGHEVGKTSDGILYGLHAGYEYVPDLAPKESLADLFRNIEDVNRYKVSLDYRTGPAKYGDRNNTVIEDKYNQQMLEGRAIGGYDFKLNDSTRWSPFMGLGYRYQLDPSGAILDVPQTALQDIGTTTTYSSVGFDLRQPYEVHTHYLYLPIGVMTNTDIADSWSIGFNAEFDVLLWGMIKSNFSDIGTLYVEDGVSNPRTVKLKNTNNSLRGGIGFRGATRLTKKQRSYDWYIEPFIRYWHINESDKEQFPLKVSDGTDRILFQVDQVTPYNWTEPESSTTEYGIQVGVSY